MNTDMIMDIDPLNSYEYPVHPVQNYPIQPNYPYPANHPYKPPYPYQNIYQTVTHNHNDNNRNNDNHNENNQTEDTSQTEDVKPVINARRKKLKGKQSAYWNKKIADKDFAFYGCSVCNISYTDIKDLDQHVQIHTNRMTSYDLRLQNIKKRKRIKKEKKKIKKEAKIKQELELDIKPEDGYIGEELTIEYDNKDNNRNDDYGNNDNKPSNKDNENVNIDNKTANNDNKPTNTNKQDVHNDNKTANTDNIPANTDNQDVGNDNKTTNNDNKAANNDNEDVNNGCKENKSMNSNERNFINVYKCFACNKQFALSYYLRIHVRSHTDEKPYPCKFCSQSFITASKLGRHNKRVHLSTRNQCRICYKYFNRFEALVAHFDKKHPDDKLEGEPYDYNAILPYLKELEDQMQMNEAKPKVETPWPDNDQTDAQTDRQIEAPTDVLDVKMDEVDEKTDVKTEAEMILPTKYEFEIDVKKYDNNIVVEEIKVDIEVKQETDIDCDDDPEPDVDVTPDVDVNPDVDSVKDERESGSESDYFPSEGWAASPRRSPPPAPRASCEVCQKTFSSNSYLVVHMRTHTGEKPYSCYICGRGFITAGKMHRHVMTHDETWKGEDGIKPDGIDIKDDPDGESPTIKKRIKQAKDKLLKKNKDVEKKYKRRPHACEYCQKRFLHIETLQVHKKSHSGEALVLRCNFCLEPQPDRPTLEAHEAAHAGPKPYVCTVCGKQYTKKETMVYHKKTHKTTEPSYVCDICSKRFRSQTKLQRHIASHSTERFVLRYECPVCAHMFHTKYHVQMHLNTHQKEGLIQEENRSAVLAMVLQNARKIPKSTENNTANLSENIPTDERSRICNICGQIFQHFYYLEEHLKSHGSKIAIENVEKEEVKKYTCHICSKSFKLHYYLKLHSYTHTKEKPYICQQCGKGFITKGKLKRHLETHQGLKKYQCHICYKFFTRPSYLRIHVRTIHGTQDYNFRDYTLASDDLPQGE